MKRISFSIDLAKLLLVSFESRRLKVKERTIAVGNDPDYQGNTKRADKIGGC